MRPFILLAAAALGDAFFEAGTLVLALAQEGSGGVRHEITARASQGAGGGMRAHPTP